MKENIKDLLKNPLKLLIFLNNRKILVLSDEKYLKIRYKAVLHKELDLQEPKTFNEKLQWLKLHDRNPEYTKMVDKYEVKKYVSDVIGEEYVIPTIGVWDKFEDINFDDLPKQFVLKTTHDSGSVVVCKDKDKLDINKTKKKLTKSLKRDFYNCGREWPYKNVKPRIIAEKYMEDDSGDLKDYKVYAFNGECDLVLTCLDRAKGETKFVYYDRNWNLQKEMTNDGIKYGDTIKTEKPKTLDKMFEFASILSKGIPFVRVDFYEAKGELYFGELTFFPSSGFDANRKEITDKILTEKLKLNIGG